MFITFIQSIVTGAPFRVKHHRLVSISLALCLIAQGGAIASDSGRVRAVDGVRCADAEHRGSYGPVIYSANAIERTYATNLLRNDERREIETIRRYIGVNYAKLRFTHLGKRLIVFVSQFGDCDSSAPGYRVLNGYCNEYYEPGEMPNRTHPTPGCLGARRPWYTDDASNKHLSDDPSYWSRKSTSM